MPASPAITVVVPVHNRDGTLRRALSSVQRQSFTDFECIVVDDASTRCDVEAIVAAHADERLRYVRRDANGGPYAARYTGYGLSRGRILIALDSDDELYPWALDQAHRHLEERPEVDIVCALYLRSTDSRVFVRVRDAPRVVTPEQASREPGVPDRVAAVRRPVVAEWLERSGDYFASEAHQYISAALRHTQLYVDEPWVLIHPDGDDRVSQAGFDEHLDRYVRDVVKFLDEYRELIDSAPSVALDEVLASTYFELRRRRRPEARQVADALRRRRLSPRAALAAMLVSRIKGRLPGVRREVFWV